MSEKLGDPKEFSGKDEEVVATMPVGDAYRAQPHSLKRFFCTNCRAGIHCEAKDVTENEKYMCSNDKCKCKCRTHYVGRDGKLRPFGTPDDSEELLKKEMEQMNKERDERDAFYDKINAQWRKDHPKSVVPPPDKVPEARKEY